MSGRAAASIAIAGGGLIGLATAWRLAQRGFRVCVFDAGTLGAEASWAGAGMLVPGAEIEDDSEFGKLALESRALYAGFVRELTAASGLAIDFQEVGAIDLAYSNEELAALEARAARQTALGIASKAVEPERVKAFWPRVRAEGLVGARFYPGDGLVNPREIVLALCAVNRQLGVRLEQNCALLEIEDRGREVAVTTQRGNESFQAAVIAAGAWSSSSIRLAGQVLPEAWPVRGHLLGYQQPERTCGTIVRHGHTYLMQRRNGLLIAGGSVERVGFDRKIDAGIAGQLAKRAGFVMPHLAETTPTETWIGFRPASDRVRIGRWNNGRVYLGYGHYRNGILLAPVTAGRLAAAVAEQVAFAKLDSSAS